MRAVTPTESRPKIATLTSHPLLVIRRCLFAQIYQFFIQTRLRQATNETNGEHVVMAGTTQQSISGGEYIRPFGPNAPWNIPISVLDVDPDSASLARLLWNDSFTDRADRNFNISTTSYTYAVYEVADDTPYFKVNDKNGWGNLDGKYIPFDPKWKPAPGSDGQMIILDPETGKEWDLWQVSFDGKTVNISNGNLVGGYGGSDSYFEREVGFEPSRGAGIPYLAMLVRPEEVAQGRIEHALSMPIRNTSGSEFVAPATKIEHMGVRLNGIPEGTRFALDVTYDEIDAHLASLPGDVPQVTIDSLRVIMVAMKEYGWFITDTAGSTHFQLESTTSAKKEWAALGMVDTQYGWNTYPQDALDGLFAKDRIVAYAPSELYAGYNPGDSGAKGNTSPGTTDVDAGIPFLEISGGSSDDDLNGSDADEMFEGYGGHDRIVASGGNDKANGGWGRDVIFGGAGRDVITGSSGKDRLFAGDGDDFMYGGRHRDVLRGGAGNDELTGGRGPDRFVFQTGWNVDTVTDFNPSGRYHDRLDLRALDSVVNWNDLSSNHLYQDGRDAVIDGLNGDRIILEGVRVDDLHASDFLF